MATTVKKKKRSKGEEYLLFYPEKAKSFKAYIMNLIIKILKEHPLETENDIIFWLITSDPFAKDHAKQKGNVSYFRYIIWEMAKKKMIFRAKIVGDRKHTFYFLPEQLPQLKDKIIQTPRG